MKRKNGPSEGTMMTIGGAMALISAVIFAHKTNEKNNKLKTINTLNKTVLGCLNKRLKDGKIRDDEYVGVALKAKDNLEEVIQVGCNKFIDTVISEIRAKEIMTTK